MNGSTTRKKTLSTLGLAALLALTGLAGVTGCARNENARRLKETERIPMEEIARRDAARPEIEAPPPLPEPDVVASVGTCAPPADNLTFFGACCNGQSCSGRCVRPAGPAETTASVCACYDTPGGCGEGYVCCKLRRGCVLPKDCQAP